MGKVDFLKMQVETLKDLYCARLLLLSEEYEGIGGIKTDNAELVFNNFAEHLIMSIDKIMGE